ncbi:G-protein coupled receptor 157-like [Pomacea canaliculata]|uniref:G-protein coupled receptor 157-like n=1 Tax=Pomacea canaliculata TaxID=400727 RepID=UPI000D732295|nr:G-protein coupled receptor 157-like [Pomacea canaliculata]
MTSPSPENISDATAASEYVMSDMDMAYVIVVMITSVLSTVGCVLIIGLHVAYRPLRTTGRGMLVQLSVADLLTALGNLMGVLWYLFKDSAILHRNMAYCETHSALTIFSSIASFLWTLTIGFSLYLAIVHNRPHVTRKFWNPIWLVCWGIPTAVTTAALASRVLGYDLNLHQASWCWIDPKAELNVMWNFLTGKAWELAAYFVTVFLYTVVRITILRHQSRTDILERHSRRNNLNDANTKLLFVPLVFIVMRLWGTVRFLLGLIDYVYASSPNASWIVPLQDGI